MASAFSAALFQRRRLGQRGGRARVWRAAFLLLFGGGLAAGAAAGLDRAGGVAAVLASASCASSGPWGLRG